MKTIITDNVLLSISTAVGPKDLQKILDQWEADFPHSQTIPFKLTSGSNEGHLAIIVSDEPRGERMTALEALGLVPGKQGKVADKAAESGATKSKPKFDL